MGKEKTELEVVTGEIEDKNEKYLVKLKKPYTFEDKTYEEIDLSGLENMTANDLIQANKVLDRAGTISFMPETHPEFICVLANRATGLPVEFFKGLSARDFPTIKNRVTNFFYGAD